MGRPKNEQWSWLPPFCYFDRGRIIYKPPGHKALRVCSADTPKNDVLERLATIASIKPDPQLLTRDAIVAAAKPLARVNGIYFLIKNGQVVYVGKSTNIRSRLMNHHFLIGDKFDAYHFIEAAQEDLAELERLYIRSLRPQLNTVHNDGSRTYKRRYKHFKGL